MAAAASSWRMLAPRCQAPHFARASLSSLQRSAQISTQRRHLSLSTRPSLEHNVDLLPPGQQSSSVQGASNAVVDASSSNQAVIPDYQTNPQWILPIPEQRQRQLTSGRTGKKINIIAPPRSAAKFCPEPIKAVNAAEIAKLDPTGARTRLFALDNPDAVRVRDIVLVRQKNGDPFAGVVMRIKRAGPNSGILLRNTVAGTGVEMDFKIYSPTVTGIELVQRRPRTPKQFRLYYLRDPKHDIGSVDNIVRQYLRSKTTAAAGKTVLQAAPRPLTKSSKKKR